MAKSLDLLSVVASCNPFTTAGPTALDSVPGPEEYSQGPGRRCTLEEGDGTAAPDRAFSAPMSSWFLTSLSRGDHRRLGFVYLFIDYSGHC